jgi:hypothetical protein
MLYVARCMLLHRVARPHLVTVPRNLQREDLHLEPFALLRRPSKFVPQKLRVRLPLLLQPLLLKRADSRRNFNRALAEERA